MERSPLEAEDLNKIPFTLLVPNCPITFMEHKRCVVHIALDSARAMKAFMGRALPIDEDIVIAGAILADVGKMRPCKLKPLLIHPGISELFALHRADALASGRGVAAQPESTASSSPTPGTSWLRIASGRRTRCCTFSDFCLR